MDSDAPSPQRRPARWSGGSRYSPVIKIPRVTWVRNHRGNWKLSEKEVTEVDFCYLASKQPPGFNRGARISRVRNTQQ